MMQRRDFLKTALFSSTGAALISTIPGFSEIRKQNENIQQHDESYIAPRSRAAGAFAITFGSISGSADFPIRPKNAVASDGQFVWFVWPSEKGDARGYLKRTHELPEQLQEIPELCVFRLRQGEPEAPYYLRWRKGDYSLYTPPGALVSRAATLIKESDVWENHAQALSDLRFATMINLAYSKGKLVVDKLADLTRQAQQARNLRDYYPAFLELLTKSRA